MSDHEDVSVEEDDQRVDPDYVFHVDDDIPDEELSQKIPRGAAESARKICALPYRNKQHPDIYTKNKIPKSCKLQSTFHVLEALPINLMVEKKGYCARTLAELCHFVNQFMTDYHKPVVDGTVKVVLQIAPMIIQILGEGGEMCISSMIKLHTNVYNDFVPSHKLVMHTNLMRHDKHENVFLLSENAIWIGGKEANALEYTPFACDRIITVGTHNTFFYNAVEFYVDKMRKNTLDIKDCVRFIELFNSEFRNSNRMPKTAPATATTYMTSCDIKNSSFDPADPDEVNIIVKKTKLYILGGKFNNFEGIGRETGCTVLRLDDRTKDRLIEATEERIKFLNHNENSDWVKKPEKVRARRGQAISENPTSHVPKVRDLATLMKIRRGEIIDIMKRRLYRPQEGDLAKNAHFNVRLDFPMLHFRQQLAAIFADESVDFMFAMLVHVLKDYSTLDVVAATIEDDVDNTINTNFFNYMECAEATKGEFVPHLTQFMVKARKYFLAYLQVQKSHIDTASVAACLYLNEAMILRVVERALQHQEFLKETLLDKILLVHDENNRPMLIELVPAILVHLLYAFVYDAYYMHDRELQDEMELSPSEMGVFSEMPESHVRFAKDVTLPKVSFVKAIRYGELIPKFDCPAELTPEVCRTTFTPQKWRVPTELCQNLDWTLYLAYKSVEIDERGDFRASVQWIKSAQAAALSETLEPLVKEFGPQYEKMLVLPLLEELRPCADEFDKLRGDIIANYSKLFTKADSRFLTIRMLKFFARDVIYGFFFKFTKLTGLPWKRNEKDWREVVRDISQVRCQIDSSTLGMVDMAPTNIGQERFNLIKLFMSAALGVQGEQNLVVHQPFGILLEGVVQLRAELYQLQPRKHKCLEGMMDVGHLALPSPNVLNRSGFLFMRWSAGAAARHTGAIALAAAAVAGIAPAAGAGAAASARPAPAAASALPPAPAGRTKRMAVVVSDQKAKRPAGRGAGGVPPN